LCRLTGFLSFEFKLEDMATQQVFETVYRGRQRVLHHMAYMRMSKVLLIQQILHKVGIDLAGKSLFDYGFGAGTFFRYCPLNTRLFGVEMDPVTVEEVGRMLAGRGHPEVTLAPIDPEHWATHPLLQQSYDVVLCSHVLEHLPDPVDVLRRLKECLKPDGALVVLLPLNERRSNPHHVHTVDRGKIADWLQASALRMVCYQEADPWTYWTQPLFTQDSKPGDVLVRILAQVFSLGLGIPSTLVGYRMWEQLSKPFGRLTRSKPTQAAFVCNRIETH
jgi:2-polyprenyl-3-methyl-5-hydroxy-6-metoxy-1,4-benzoquinol methylase